MRRDGARASRALVWTLQKGAAATRGGYKAVAAIAGTVALAVATLYHIIAASRLFAAAK